LPTSSSVPVHRETVICPSGRTQHLHPRFTALPGFTAPCRSTMNSSTVKPSWILQLNSMTSKNLTNESESHLVTDMQVVIERLRISKRLSDAKFKDTGRIDGRGWAKYKAEAIVNPVPAIPLLRSFSSSLPRNSLATVLQLPPFGRWSRWSVTQTIIMLCILHMVRWTCGETSNGPSCTNFSQALLLFQGRNDVGDQATRLNCSKRSAR